MASDGKPKVWWVALPSPASDQEDAPYVEGLGEREHCQLHRQGEKAEALVPPPCGKHALVIYGEPTSRATERQFPLIIAAFGGIQQAWEWSPNK